MIKPLDMPLSCLKPQSCPTGQDMLLGTSMLRLVSDWNGWVHRRVDSLRFAGEDETVIERRHSMDFTLPAEAVAASRELIGDDVALVPITFMNKWRLPHLSVWDETGRAIPLLERRDHVRISAAMLMSMAYQLVTGEIGPVPGRELMPPDVAWDLCGIAAEDPGIAIAVCATLGETRAMLPSKQASTASARWRARLIVDPAFMELALELAHAFPLIVLCQQSADEPRRRVIKFSYDWPLAHPLGIGLLARARSVPRRIRPSTDTRRWVERAEEEGKVADCGTLVLSTVCPTLNVEARASDTGLPCVEVKLMGHDRHPVYRRLRPNVAVSLECAPPGHYWVEVREQPGFNLVAPVPDRTVEVRAGKVTRVPIYARQHDVVKKPELTRSGPMRPASLLSLAQRGVALRSKPLMVRLRLGDGGARHFEFEGPPGMQITRAKLVADRRFDRPDDVAELDLVLESRQRPHLYAPAGSTASESGYAFLNLRPRVETIIRSAVLTALLTAVPMVLFALFWLHGSPPQVNPGALVLGIPVVLSAYFAQSVQSRVTQAMLYGVRITALLPALLGAVAAALLLLAHDTGNAADQSPRAPAVTQRASTAPAVSRPPKAPAAPTPARSRQATPSRGTGARADENRLIDTGLARILFAVVAGCSVLVAGLLVAAQLGATRPPEQAWTDNAQGKNHRRRYLRRRTAAAAPVERTHPAAQHAPNADVATRAAHLRDELLERSVGLSRQTRELLFRRRHSWGFMNPEAPPALYFDAAEAVPIFRGLQPGSVADGLRQGLAGAEGRWAAVANEYDMVIRGAGGYTQGR